RDEQNPLLAAAIGPIGDASIVGADRAALSAIVAVVEPERFPRHSVGSRNGAARPCGEVEAAANHEWRHFPGCLRTRSHSLGLPPPDHFEIFHVTRVDLFKRRIARASRVASVYAPLTVRRRALLSFRKAPQRTHTSGNDEKSIFHGRSSFIGVYWPGRCG